MADPPKDWWSFRSTNRSNTSNAWGCKRLLPKPVEAKPKLLRLYSSSRPTSLVCASKWEFRNRRSTLLVKELITAESMGNLIWFSKTLSVRIVRESPRRWLLCSHTSVLTLLRWPDFIRSFCELMWICQWIPLLSHAPRFNSTGMKVCSCWTFCERHGSCHEADAAEG